MPSLRSDLSGYAWMVRRIGKHWGAGRAVGETHCVPLKTKPWHETAHALCGRLSDGFALGMAPATWSIAACEKCIEVAAARGSVVICTRCGHECDALHPVDGEGRAHPDCLPIPASWQFTDPMGLDAWRLGDGDLPEGRWTALIHGRRVFVDAQGWTARGLAGSGAATTTPPSRDVESEIRRALGLPPLAAPAPHRGPDKPTREQAARLPRVPQRRYR